MSLMTDILTQVKGYFNTNFETSLMSKCLFYDMNTQTIKN